MVPPPHTVPSATLLNDEGVTPGWQLWQAFEGSAAPDAKKAPPMKQPAAEHTPAEQNSSPPQLVPSDTFDHAEVLADGRQVWHAFAGLTLLILKNAPPMKHPGEHVPEVQFSSVPHDVPSVRLPQLLIPN